SFRVLARPKAPPSPQRAGRPRDGASHCWRFAMKRTVEQWSIEEIEKRREKIQFPEFQREKRLWSDDKKSLLIDSILKDIDIPKLYINQTTDGIYEVVDGQQRLWAIWDF